MNAEETRPLTIREREHRLQLDNLNTAQRALRRILHLHGVDTVARQHIDRALNHVREACIAVNEPGHARNVPKLVEDLAKVERLMEKLLPSPQNRPSVTTQTIG